MPLAAAAVALLKQHRECPDQFAKGVLHLLLDTLCRHTECQHFYVSAAAQRKADSKRLGDLGQYTSWYDQTRRMGDTGRKTFHWDHVHTVKGLREDLLRLKRPTLRSVRHILKRASVAWILKTEDKRLNDLGFKEDRPNPHGAYKRAGIKLRRIW